MTAPLYKRCSLCVNKRDPCVYCVKRQHCTNCNGAGYVYLGTATVPCKACQP